MAERRFSRVAILMGGPSAEREVSLSSGRECAAALREAGYDVVEIDAGQGTDVRTLPDRLRAARPEVVFNALHGPFGEGGAVQGMLEVLGLPYTHSGVAASALAMDKQRAKTVLAAAGVPVPTGRIVPRAEAAAAHAMPPPYVVKPNAEGSSVGVHIVPEGANRPPALGPEMPGEVLVEAFAPGRELTVSAIGAPGEERALAVTDILSAGGGWYDYAAKYETGGSRHVLPADLPSGIAEACRAHALTAHRALGCRSLSRTDFRFDDATGALLALETNTQPGMTPTSLTPEQALHDGMSFPALCAFLAEDASCDR
ncbi:D-alanine--D-alanine ligase [Hasllibacter halocynthiae]|uniref:D-alanine--D-alanine ligase n=2 Tax=Hasllibacter halocynthiae TaxID=595589 RepID=A0A2T0X9H2_9RHOB|nr:D-alanine--D-alanine ligase [Hasllibacter halocynthiae]